MKYFISQDSKSIQVSLDGGSPTDGGIWTEVDVSMFSVLISGDGTLPGLAKVCNLSVDTEAGNARAKYITTTPGQAEVYISKAIYAKEIVAAGYQVDLAKYPLIQAEMARLNTNSLQVACQVILQTEAAWQQIAAAVEQLRLGFKSRVITYTESAQVISDYIYVVTQLRKL